MNGSYLFDMTFNNVVFAGRNKAYGAYELRQTYSRHILAAALLATVVFTTGLGWPLLKKTQEVIHAQLPALPEKEGVVLDLSDGFVLPPPPAEEAAEQPNVKPVEQTQKVIPFTKPVIVKDNAPVTGPEMPDQDQLKGAIIGTTAKEGESSGNQNLSAATGEPGGTGAGTGEISANTVYDFAAEMPYFEGGEQGLLKYISKKIKYPRAAVNEQVEGMVVVSFVVNRQGEITDATILKGLGYGTDEEALRVINSMPNWTPGRQNGKPVAVRYTLPIRFSMKR
ncbi:energy transducer TonB [Pontibacter sp. HJ8]